MRGLPSMLRLRVNTAVAGSLTRCLTAPYKAVMRLPRRCLKKVHHRGCQKTSSLFLLFVLGNRLVTRKRVLGFNRAGFGRSLRRHDGRGWFSASRKIAPTAH